MRVIATRLPLLYYHVSGLARACGVAAEERPSAKRDSTTRTSPLGRLAARSASDSRFVARPRVSGLVGHQH
jgi:hypothetical protein